MSTQTRSIRREQADQTRRAILRAAVREFSRKGFDGASTVAIMESAKVNTSLLYYYFKSKTGLYEAVILDALEKYAKRQNAILKSSASPAERLLRAALVHFDRHVRDPEVQSLWQQELVRLGSGGREFAKILARDFFKPWLKNMKETIEQAIEEGELRKMNWRFATDAIFGANAYYFLNAQLFGMALGTDPFSKAALESQRRETIEFLGQALFADPVHGSDVASRVLADMPMPKYKKLKGEESR